MGEEGARGRRGGKGGRGELGRWALSFFGFAGFQEEGGPKVLPEGKMIAARHSFGRRSASKMCVSSCSSKRFGQKVVQFPFFTFSPTHDPATDLEELFRLPGLRARAFDPTPLREMIPAHLRYPFSSRIYQIPLPPR